MHKAKREKLLQSDLIVWHLRGTYSLTSMLMKFFHLKAITQEIAQKIKLLNLANRTEQFEIFNGMKNVWRAINFMHLHY